MVLSHAHLDHCGRLPLLVRRGFRGPIYAQRASCELVAILLADAARLEERDDAVVEHREFRSVDLYADDTMAIVAVADGLQSSR